MKSMVRKLTKYTPLTIDQRECSFTQYPPQSTLFQYVFQKSPETFHPLLWWVWYSQNYDQYQLLHIKGYRNVFLFSGREVVASYLCCNFFPSLARWFMHERVHLIVHNVRNCKGNVFLECTSRTQLGLCQCGGRQKKQN